MVVSPGVKNQEASGGLRRVPSQSIVFDVAIQRHHYSHSPGFPRESERKRKTPPPPTTQFLFLSMCFHGDRWTVRGLSSTGARRCGGFCSACDSRPKSGPPNESVFGGGSAAGDGVKQDQRNTRMAASLERTHELPTRSSSPCFWAPNNTEKGKPPKGRSAADTMYSDSVVFGSCSSPNAPLSFFYRCLENGGM